MYNEQIKDDGERSNAILAPILRVSDRLTWIFLTPLLAECRCPARRVALVMAYHSEARVSTPEFCEPSLPFANIKGSVILYCIDFFFPFVLLWLPDVPGGIHKV